MNGGNPFPNYRYGVNSNVVSAIYYYLFIYAGIILTSVFCVEFKTSEANQNNFQMQILKLISSFNS